MDKKRAETHSTENTYSEIMNVETTCQYLGITRKTLMKLVNQRKIPMIHAGGRRLFRKTRILEALDRMSTDEAA